VDFATRVIFILIRFIRVRVDTRRIAFDEVDRDRDRDRDSLFAPRTFIHRFDDVRTRRAVRFRWMT